MAGRITDLDKAMTLLAQGKGIIMPFSTIATSITAIVQASGGLNPNVGFNAVGTVLGSAYYGIPLPPGTNPLRLINFTAYSASGGWLSNLYKVGTLNLAATGDQFTRDAGWTGPLKRNIMGVATPISLHLLVVMRTANSVTAPVFRLRTAAGGAGYVNQDGVSVVGTKTITAPGVGVTQGAVYVMRLEDGDSGVRDVTAIEVTTASSTGVADVYLMEMLAVHGSELGQGGSVHDKIVGGLELPDIRPAAPNTGAVTSYLVLHNFTNGSSTSYGTLVAVEDTP